MHWRVSAHKVITIVIQVLPFGQIFVVDYRLLSTTVDHMEHREQREQSKGHKMVFGSERLHILFRTQAREPAKNADGLSCIYCILAKCDPSHRCKQQGGLCEALADRVVNSIYSMCHLSFSSTHGERLQGVCFDMEKANLLLFTNLNKT